MKRLILFLLLALSASAATVYTTTTGAITTGATWGGSLPATTDIAVIRHACTLNGTVTFTNLTVDTANGGTLTVSGTSVINAAVTTTHLVSVNSITLAASANLTINGVVTIGNMKEGAGPWRGFTTSGNNVSLTINGNVVKTGTGYGIRYSNTGTVTINGGVDCQAAQPVVMMTSGAMSACTITGTCTNSTPDGSDYGYVVQVQGTGNCTVNGDIYITGIGWGVRNEGSGAVVINGSIRTTWTPGWTSGADSVDNFGTGTYTVNGDVHHQDSDVGIYARNGSGLVTINGNVYYTNQNRIYGVGYARGSVQAVTNSTIVIHGHVISPTAAGMTNTFRASGGTVTIWGDLISPIAIVDGGGVLNAYGQILSANSTNNGTINAVGRPTIAAGSGTLTQILEPTVFVGH